MKQFLRWSLPLVALSLFGVGCFHFVPRIVQVPDAPTTVGQAPVAETQVVAYLRLNGAKASVSRGGTSVPAVDGAEIVSGDTVSVTSGAANLIYPEAGNSLLEAGASAQLIADGPDTGNVFTEVRLVAGSIWTRFERLLGPDEHFSVEANGVVATVRGTGFGVSLVGQDVDVQVADHQVDVAFEGDEAQDKAESVEVDAGEGLRVQNGRFSQVNISGLRAVVRTLTLQERAKAGFVFGSTSIPASRLRAPLVPIKLKIAAMVLSNQLRERIDLLKQRQAVIRGFVAPTRGATPVETAPLNVTPSVTGPGAGQ